MVRVLKLCIHDVDEVDDLVPVQGVFDERRDVRVLEAPAVHQPALPVEQVRSVVDALDGPGVEPRPGHDADHRDGLAQGSLRQPQSEQSEHPLDDLRHHAVVELPPCGAACQRLREAAQLPVGRGTASGGGSAVPENTEREEPLSRVPSVVAVPGSDVRHGALRTHEDGGGVCG